MRSKLILAFIGVCVAGSASAQTYDTVCQNNVIDDPKYGVTCHTTVSTVGAVNAVPYQPSYNPNAFSQGYQQGAQIGAAIGIIWRRHHAAAMERKAEKLNQDVGALLASGKCQDAQDLALKNGNLPLANAAKAYCTPS